MANSLQEAISKYPTNLKHISYGTAGFRTKAEDLDHVLFRMGMLAALRSRAKGSAAVGLMITASHNPEPDNGVKLVDPQGEMLEQSWEAIATQLVNLEDSKVQEQLSQIAMFAGIDVGSPALVFIGRDTRPSSARLSDAAVAGVEAYNGRVVDYGVISTPMLHFYIASFNAGKFNETDVRDAYYNDFANAFKALSDKGNDNQNYLPEVDFDGANGVGAIVIQKFMQVLGNNLKLKIYNSDTVTRGRLNNKCGADFVKTYRRIPEGLEVHKHRRCVAVDGDADRIVYFYIDDDDKLHLMDGDRIATLVAAYLMDLVSASGLAINLGLVQTAYANGNSTKYISESLKVPVSCTLTGVKHLHHRATQYDIGVYFEANGHGTVVFSDKATRLIIAAATDDTLDETKKTAAVKLKKTMEVINTTVGDAISDMFLVESILLAKGWSIEDWESAYTDLPSTLLKVTVKDRNAIETTDAERKCVRPRGLQDAIDRLVAKVPSGRSFVRPSGTEDIVRVYAEAESEEAADRLGVEVARQVFDLAMGIGVRP